MSFLLSNHVLHLHGCSTDACISSCFFFFLIQHLLVLNDTIDNFCFGPGTRMERPKVETAHTVRDESGPEHEPAQPNCSIEQPHNVHCHSVSSIILLTTYRTHTVLRSQIQDHHVFFLAIHDYMRRRHTMQFFYAQTMEKTWHQLRRWLQLSLQLH